MATHDDDGNPTLNEGHPVDGRLTLNRYVPMETRARGYKSYTEPMSTRLDIPPISPRKALRPSRLQAWVIWLGTKVGLQLELPPNSIDQLNAAIRSGMQKELAKLFPPEKP